MFRLAPASDWTLIATPYILRAVTLNLPRLPQVARQDWERLRNDLTILDDVLTLEWPVVFPASKDRPILFSALAWADVLLTLDRIDFGSLIGNEFYGLPVLTPAMFLEQESAFH